MSTVPSIKGIIGDKLYYQCTMNAKDLIARTEPVEEFFSEDDSVLEFNYPVYKYPEKIIYISLDKQNEIKGRLTGIKGQYLLFENGSVFNVRRHTGYEVSIT